MPGCSDALVSLPWDTLVAMNLPSDLKALLMLRKFRTALPDVPPSERAEHPACVDFKEAACLVVAGRYDEAVRRMTESKVIKFPGVT